MDEGLIQEIFCGDPWKMLVGCIMLNQTSHKQVRAVITDFFERWPNAGIAANADEAEMAEVIKPLGLYNRRAKNIKKFSKMYVEFNEHCTDLKWEEVNALYGIGKYGADSYEIFVKHNYDIEPTDKELIKYLNDKKNNNIR